MREQNTVRTAEAGRALSDRAVKRRTAISGFRRGNHGAIDTGSVEPNEAHLCGHRLKPNKVKWLRRKRDDGSTYLVRLETGRKCERSAVVAVYRNGKNEYRCERHAGK